MSNGQQTDDELWGAIELSNWKVIPYIKSELATEQDIIAGRAVFRIDPQGGTHEPLNIEIPSLAYHVDVDTGERTLVVVIQGERVNDQQVVGIRYFEGGNGACTLPELEFIDEESIEK